jgi:hypothetical protein
LHNSNSHLLEGSILIFCFFSAIIFAVEVAFFYVHSIINVFALEISSAFIEIYSKIPIYEDNIDDIIGVLFVKDLIPHFHKKI